MLNFNAIDVETANADRASICQIGIVHICNGEIEGHWQSLINPEAWFDPWNVSIHGIAENDVWDSPTIPEVREELRQRLRGSILISHTAFDRVAFERAMKRYNLEQLQVTWIDSAMVVRRAWPEKYGRRGYGLKNVASELGISFKHHDAVEDARAAAEVMLCACDATGLDLAGWLRRVEQPIFSRVSQRASQTKRKRVKHEGNVDGPLFGETILFTGVLSLPRWKAAKMAAAAGCRVVDSASKKVTLLILGAQDTRKFRGYEKSGKHRRMEVLIKKGAEIQILSEDDFMEMMVLAGQNVRF